MANPSIERKYLILITTVSLLVPILVAVLLYSPFKIESSHVWIYSLPHLNALLNTVTALLLVLGWLFIKQKKVVMHKNTMVMAFILGTVFLIAYVIYHASAETTVYGDTIGNGLLTAQELAAVGFWRMIYLIVLISHIVRHHIELLWVKIKNCKVIFATLNWPFFQMAKLATINGFFHNHGSLKKYTYQL